MRGANRVDRYGDQEFLIVLPDTALEVTLGAAEPVRCKLCNNPLLRVDGMNAIVTRAREALYRATRVGHKRVYDNEKTVRC